MAGTTGIAGYLSYLPKLNPTFFCVLFHSSIAELQKLSCVEQVTHHSLPFFRFFFLYFRSIYHITTILIVMVLDDWLWKILQQNSNHGDIPPALSVSLSAKSPSIEVWPTSKYIAASHTQHATAISLPYTIHWVLIYTQTTRCHNMLHLHLFGMQRKKHRKRKRKVSAETEETTPHKETI